MDSLAYGRPVEPGLLPQVILIYDNEVDAVEFLLDFEIINVRDRTRQYAAHGSQLDCIRIHLCNHLINELYTKSPRREVVRSSAGASVVYPPFLGSFA